MERQYCVYAHLKGDRVIVKFFGRKDCKQMLSVKNDPKNTNVGVFGLEANASIYINQN